MSLLHPRWRPTAALGAVAVAALTVSLLSPITAGAQVAPAGAAASVRTAPGALPYQDAHLPTPRRVADLLDRMTLAEKVGQMTQAERADVAADPTLIATYGLGSVLSGGGSVPAQNTPEAWADTVDSFQEAALSTRLSIPLLYGVDSVHGHGNLQGATVFPHNIGLGATRDPGLLERIGHITAIETRASGPQWTFAPCICVARDDRWGRTYESFGEDPRLATRLETVIDGLQGRPGQLDRRDRVLATAKHYAGDGLTAWDTGEGDYTLDQGIDRVSRAEFRKLALSPYPAAISKHYVGSVMPSFSSVDWTDDGIGNPIKMHANKELLTGVLKGDLGFDGLVVSDWLAIHQLPGDYAQQVATSVNAGVDLFMEPASYQEFVTTLTSAVEGGQVPMSRIDDAVSRILTVKFDLGLFEKPLTDRTNIETIGSPAHRRVAREAVAKSQVLLRNQHDTLPMSPRQPIYVAGSNADNMGNQTGGWTLTWQGGSTNVVPGQTILEGLRDATRAPVRFSETASTPVPPGAAGVVVVGETPYAEGFGDVGGPRWAYDPGDNNVPRPAQTMQLSDADIQAVREVCAQAATCTVLVVSGRPMIIPPELLRKTDALVASWLPGAEGGGVADVLLGREPFSGRLPVTWPRSVAQEPINVGDADYDPLFAYGWGLRTR
ncbi:beta-glucosidase [Nocardioides psychrotolerans]|uniref:beta-glucosidase n=1 Tax=Nocardioides psychrotolerans TaxID=1005945 RepID=A0A1I3CW43_9ACTN|nr:glycoside hydrolase family 3 protein [Nocardioides psychrotolerans]GEP36923.1 beta-glucosidase [Nocardioides psychrotolerans]SFH78499.1 beta-glucosidase [Nocardioides psychrotolerans]